MTLISFEEYQKLPKVKLQRRPIKKKIPLKQK